jgi:K+ transporter
MQYRGATKVGTMLVPIMLIRFSTIAIVGAISIVQTPLFSSR